MLDLVAIDKSWVDVVLRVPALPSYDQKVLAKLVGRYPGGMGGNVACAASRLGLRTGMVSWVGDDADGHRVLADLQRFGVDTTHLVIEPGTETNYTTVLVDPSGEKAIIIVPTVFNTLDLNVQLIDYLGRARIVYCTAYDLDQLARVADVVRAAGGLVTTDIEAWALEGGSTSELLSQVDIAFINGAALRSNNPGQTAQELQAGGPRVVVLTFGAHGALACTNQELVEVPAFNVSVVDTTGAGDCFTAAFLAAYVRQLPLADGLRYAHAAAALSIMAYGARGALPTDEQVQAFLAKHA